MDEHWLGRIAPVLHHAGFVRMARGIINPWRMIDDHELFMFDNGSAKMVLDGAEYTYESPWFIIIAPATRHISYCLSDAVDIYYCHYDWEFRQQSGEPSTVYAGTDAPAPAIRRAPAYLPPCPLHGRLSSRNALELHHRVVSEFAAADSRRRLRARGLFFEELVELLAPRDENPKRSAVQPVEAEQVRQALTALAQRPFEQAPSIRDVISGLGCSYYHLERGFRRRFGVNPQQYVSLVRAERAKEILRSSGDTVAACARALGYRDAGYFIRFFRKQTGMSPAVFRARAIR